MRRRKRKREVARVQGYGPGFQAGKRSALALQNFAAEGWLSSCTVQCAHRETPSRPHSPLRIFVAPIYSTSPLPWSQ